MPKELADARADYVALLVKQAAATLQSKLHDRAQREIAGVVGAALSTGGLADHDGALAECATDPAAAAGPGSLGNPSCAERTWRSSGSIRASRGLADDGRNQSAVGL